MRTASYTYDPFGALLQTPPSNTTVERWTGRWDKKVDTQTGLIEMGERPYDPSLGRFVAVDPIDGGSLNAFDYAGQDPINDYDLSGTTAVDLLGWGGGVTAAVIGVQMWMLHNHEYWDIFYDDEGDAYSVTKAVPTPEEAKKAANERATSSRKKEGGNGAA